MTYRIKRFSISGKAAAKIIKILSKTPGKHAQDFSHDLMENAINRPIFGGVVKGTVPGGMTVAAPILKRASDLTEKRVYDNIKIGGRSISDLTKPIRRKLHKKVKPVSEVIGKIVDGVSSGEVRIPGLNL